MALLMVIIGVILLLYAARPTLKISKTEPHRGWQVLFALICFFIVGYLAYILVLLNVAQATAVNLIMASILFGGSVFVVLVIYLSRFTLEQIHRVASQEQHNALHDELTGLPNRKHLLQYLDAKVLVAQNNQLSFALVLLDIDEFKSINDSLGHFFGDLLLKQLVLRLQDRLAPNIFLARTGGDDFALVVPYADPVRIKKLCIDMRNYLRESFDIDGHMISISACPGVVYCPAHGDTTTVLMQRADIAMYMAKKQKLLLATYDHGMTGTTRQNLILAARLPSAITKQEFELFYQPLIRGEKRQVFGVEALIRWPQPDQTVLKPDAFIPLAEQSYLIRDITRWVLKTGLRQLGLWHAAGHKITLQVNISSCDLDENRLPSFVLEQLNSNNLPASCLTLEITENAIVRNRVLALEILAELSQMGVCISLDDFGTGYSSMTLLDELPLTQVKVDRSFVDNIESNHSHRAIVQSTITLGRSLNLMVVAEGIENRQQAALLAELGCDLLQGFVVAKPMDTATCSQWLDDQRLLFNAPC